MATTESRPISHHWSPIEGLSEIEQKAKLPTLDNVVDVWRQVREEMPEDKLTKFSRRLERYIAIETGILEGLYSVSRGLTLTLVEHGFAAEVIDNSKEPMSAQTIQLIKDQFAASDMVLDVVRGSRALSKGFIKELHAFLTQSQKTATAVDQFGRTLEVPLIHGDFKKQPNHQLLKDGLIHEYAPPQHVDSEMDVLFRRLTTYQERKVHPLVVAAWFHHRFTQIHPFQDGNGRVARLLSSMICIKSGMFPLRILREDREEYIDGLVAADQGVDGRPRSLSKLIDFFATIERGTILEAMTPDTSFGVEVTEAGTGLAQQVAARIAQRMGQHVSEELEERRKVNKVAEELLDRLMLGVDVLAKSTEREFKQRGIAVRARVDWGGPENGTEHWWRYQINQVTKGKHFANFSENQYWVRLTLDVARMELTFVASMHHVGRPPTGVMALVFFAELDSLDVQKQADAPPQRNLLKLGIEPIAFTTKDSIRDLVNQVMPKLDQAAALALRDLGNVVV